MAGTRKSSRLSSSQQSQELGKSPSTTGQKRKAEASSSPAAKRGKNAAQKEQKTLEEVIDGDSTFPTVKQNGHDEDGKTDDRSGDAEITNGSSPAKETKSDDKSRDPSPTNGHADPTPAPEKESSSNKPTDPKTTDAPSKKDTKPTTSQDKTSSDAVVADARSEKVPSSILEKGIVYILYRGRVNIDNPSAVTDLQRTFMILRPLPHGAKLSDGPIGDETNCRLIAIPKKTLPIGGGQKWTAFVESANVSFKDLKENFLKDDNYTTQTQGSQHTPSTKPAAEGVYAITTTGRESHFAYIMTLPSPLGEVQTELGIRQRGSFVLSVKNPKAPGPANADLGRDPGYSDQLQNEFRSLRWAPLKPDHLNYESCQFLMIGETENSIEGATEVRPEDQEKDKAEPKEELEQLEEEDESRVEHLGDEDAIYADLGVDADSYPSLETEW